MLTLYIEEFVGFNKFYIPVESIIILVLNYALDMQNDSNSIHELLQFFKHLKLANSQVKSKDISSLSFSSKNYQSTHRNPLESISIENMQNCHSRTQHNRSKHNVTVFDKLYQESRSIQMKKCRLEYETRRSKQQKERSQCTFSPNIRSRFKIKTQYDSVEDNSTFYEKNIEWLQRKQKSIKKMQIEKNQEGAGSFTFTPCINKMKKKDLRTNNQNRVINYKGVNDFLQRQEKAKKKLQYIKERQKNPYSHIWNIKRGHFSYIK